MLLLTVCFIALFVIIALAPGDVMQTLLACAWVLLALSGFGAIIAALLR